MNVDEARQLLGMPQAPQPEPVVVEEPRGTEIHLRDENERRTFERRAWKLGRESRPPTSIETKDGYFSASRYDAEADAWVYRQRCTAPSAVNRTW